MSRLSGFCNPSNPRDSHQRCAERPVSATCACPCHWTVEPPEPVAAEPAAVDPVPAVTGAVDTLAARLPDLLEACTDPDAADMADLFATIHDARVQLQGIERDAEAATARAMLADYAERPDLRVERSRATDRKAWDHESWQRDVRAKAIRAAGLAGAQGVVDAHGELVPADALHELMAAVQAAHGSAAPKTTTLRGLGLDARDYCESTPGGYRVKVTRMAAEQAAEQSGGVSDDAA